MISILIPTRNRPNNIQRLWDSILNTVDNISNIEIILYIDDDDNSYDNLSIPFKMIKGPRIVLSEMWNKCFEYAKFDILMHCGDDIVFRTKSWDIKVINEFNQSLDKIIFVYGNDGVHNENFGTHGFIHRKWVEAVGYFVPPYFASDYNDTWLNEVADLINRRKHIDIYTEHMHPCVGKADIDITHQERLIRHSIECVDDIYLSKKQERIFDAEKLKKIIDGVNL